MRKCVQYKSTNKQNNTKYYSVVSSIHKTVYKTLVTARRYVSAVFAVDRCPSVRPSVRLSVCLYIQKAEGIVKLLS